MTGERMTLIKRFRYRRARYPFTISSMCPEKSLLVKYQARSFYKSAVQQQGERDRFTKSAVQQQSRNDFVFTASCSPLNNNGPVF